MNVIIPICLSILLLVVFGVAIFFMNRHYQERLNTEVTRAQRSEQLKSVFLANVSHALRTPLNAIIGFSQLLLDDMDGNMPAEQQKEIASQINMNGHHLLTFITQLLELSNFEGNMPSFTLIEVNLAELMASYRREALITSKKELSLRLRTDLSPHCKATLDTNFMHQLMMHLLTNATKNTTTGDITVNYGYERKGMKVSIAYMGKGQGELLSEDVFDFLQREDAMMLDNDISGMGLAICKAIIDALNGELDIDTDNGMKTIVSFWFPCRMVDRNKE